ncbi:MAG: hypothetical protein ACJAX5_003488, partial [Patiriisocius sp.]
CRPQQSYKSYLGSSAYYAVHPMEWVGAHGPIY